MLVTNFQIETLSDTVKKINRRFAKRLLIYILEENYTPDDYTMFQIRKNIRGIFKALLLDENCDVLIENNIIRSAKKYEFSHEDDLFVCLYGVLHEVSLLYIESTLKAIGSLLDFKEEYTNYIVSRIYIILLDPDHKWGVEFENALTDELKGSLESEIYNDINLFPKLDTWIAKNYN